MTKNRQMLIFDKDLNLINILIEQIKKHEDINFFYATTAEEILKQTNENIFEIILLGSGNSDLSGELVCTLLRENGVTIPIIALTCADQDIETNFQNNKCANDYINLPLRLATLLKRIRFYFRQKVQGENSELSIGPYSFQPSNKLLINKENSLEIYLTDKESAILLYLYNTTESVTSREILLDEVWGYNENVNTHTLETHVYRLRQKIELDSSKAKILLTEIGGYRLST
tara:strand:- start:791 stop:1480 length:690 start_codon:yes stop_codon:yes gene_type:complete